MATSWVDAVMAMPDSWFEQLSAFQSPEKAAGYVQSLADAGADAVAFFPNPYTPMEHAAFAAEHLLPLLS